MCKVHGRYMRSKLQCFYGRPLGRRAAPPTSKYSPAEKGKKGSSRSSCPHDAPRYEFLRNMPDLMRGFRWRAMFSVLLLRRFTVKLEEGAGETQSDQCYSRGGLVLLQIFSIWLFVDIKLYFCGV